MPQAKPTLSLLVPSRKRPDALRRMYQSALDTAEGEIECVVYIDNDDDSYDDLDMPNLVKVYGPRIVLSSMWNRCQEEANGEYYMHCGDDNIFRTQGWDTKILDAFPDDKIAFVHGRDGSPQDNIPFGTHGFLHKKWVDAVGYFVPPYFSCDWNDTWLNDVSNMIGRHIFVDDVLIEHMHPAWGKRSHDNTDAEREERGRNDNVKALYDSKQYERIQDAEKLRAAMR